MTQYISIIGTGLGSATMTQEATDSIACADLLIGSARLISEHAQPGQTVITATRPEDVVEAIHSADALRVAVLMSGDVGFHSGATKVWNAFNQESTHCQQENTHSRQHYQQDRPHFQVRLIPGVSSPAFLAARLGVTWENACLVSCHGTDVDLVSPVRRHHRTLL